ncbi:CAP domain-containing protein [Flavobacterium sufflavum]|uniref:CAP domain-containing protein n=1 Tax=Flavobacterium sufflavum TaxID=1921138 RepID=A0A3S2U199_9FLAO|nr:CAP domain-containing protein [Flavobacterium sufflavum]RVT74992.1 CAP domain-containing protein [Flavobacterium sufflavum]
MKLNLSLKIMPIMALFMLNSCSSDSVDAENLSSEVKPELIVNYTYNAAELETLNLINDYRASIGLNRLERINHISYKSEEHDIYMIDHKVFNHDDFVSRSENIMKVLGAKTVAENIALNYVSPKSALNAWLNSPKHKINIVGDFTHFGIAIKEDPVTGEKYYTNIFAKI